MSIGISAATLLFLPAAAATTCPPDWTPSPTSATWGPRCYLVPPERSTSLFRCVELCEEHGGAPACIGSAEENRLRDGRARRDGGPVARALPERDGARPCQGVEPLRGG